MGASVDRPNEQKQSGEKGRARPRASSIDRTAGWLIAALTAVIMAFFAATTFAQMRTDAIHDLATQMATVTAPSIEELAQARGDLRRIETLLTVYTGAGDVGAPSGSSVSLQEVERMRKTFRSHVTGYLALPSIAGEQVYREQIQSGAAVVDELTGQVVALVEAGDWPQARQILRTRLIPQTEATGLSLVHAIDLNGDSVRSNADAIERSRRSTMRTAFALDGICVILAAIAGVIAFRGIRQYTSVIEEQQRQLEIHNEELETFAMRVAHDIRGPLTPVIMALDKGVRMAPDEPGRRMFEAASRSVHRIQALIEGLLLFARAGAVPDPAARADAVAVLHGVAEDVAAEAEAANVRIRLETSPMAPLRCSPAVLSSIVANLVRNAVKFMGEAREREVLCRAREADGNALIEVVDTGPGLTKELTERIFEPYVRAPGAKAPGIGLGLATVKRLAVAHGGRVGVESHPGAGARFWVELPLAK